MINGERYLVYRTTALHDCYKVYVRALFGGDEPVVWDNPSDVELQDSIYGEINGQ